MPTFNYTINPQVEVSRTITIETHNDIKVIPIKNGHCSNISHSDGMVLISYQGEDLLWNTLYYPFNEIRHIEVNNHE
jgi:hypothetical protein